MTSPRSDSQGESQTGSQANDQTVAILAALPRELAALGRDLRAMRSPVRDGLFFQIAQVGHTRLLLVAAGMGAQRAAVAFSSVLAHSPLAAVLSVGLAGACDPGLLPGAVVEATTVVDSNSGERYLTATPLGTSAAVLVTVPHIAGPGEKRRLLASYGAAAVDMEAATIGRLSSAHKIPFRALKAISDEHSLDLSHLARFSHPRYGHFRTGAFALHTAVRPHRWSAAASLGRNSSLALKNLTAALHQIFNDSTATAAPLPEAQRR